MEIIYDEERRMVIIDGIVYISTFAIPDKIYVRLGASNWVDIVQFFNRVYKENG